jgi:dTDP-4-amino-4,6-dideoxygalactose transaminase
VELSVKFWDPSKSFLLMEDEVMGTIREVLASGDLVMRHQMEDFEEHLAEFVGAAHGVGVSNCTDGLRLTLEALGIGPGDEVITVAHTFVATMAAIHHVGATPVLVDVGADHNMDAEQLDAAVTSRSRAIIPVHLNGRLCRMDTVLNVAKAHDLLVVEDSAQALGGSFDGVRGGAWGVAAAFSFYPAKLLGAYGDAGIVVTSDAELAARLRALRDHGRVSKTELNGWGHNCRLDNLQAAVLDMKLRHLPSWIERRRHLAGLYDESLQGLDHVKRPPSPDTGRFHDVFQNYVIESDRRDELVSHLANRGIETLVSWPTPMHHQPLGLRDFKLPVTEALSDRVVSLPMYPELEDDQVTQVTAAVHDFYS